MKLDSFDFATPSCGQQEPRRGYGLQVFVDGKTLSSSTATPRHHLKRTAKRASDRISLDDQENINPTTGSLARVEAAHRRASAASAAARATPQKRNSSDLSFHTPNQLLKNRQPLKDITPLFSKRKNTDSAGEPMSLGSTAKKAKKSIKEVTTETVDNRPTAGTSLADRLQAAREKRPAEVPQQAARSLRRMR